MKKKNLVIILVFCLLLFGGCQYERSIKYTYNHLNNDFKVCEENCIQEMARFGEEYVGACSYGCGEMGGELLKRLSIK